MKTARLLTLLGSLVLLGSAIFHGVGYFQVTGALAMETLRRPQLAGIFKACWLTFSIAMAAFALIALVARSLERGGPIVLLCAAANAVNGFLLFHFLGLFIGVYLVSIVTVLFLVGGYLQVRASPPSSSI
jgi:hypothetical protein